jgi:hypothetical protein
MTYYYQFLRSSFFLIIGVVVLSSCVSLHDGTMLPSTGLNSANFNYVGQVEGNSSAMYFFGIGGLTKSSLVGNAKSEMMRKFPLKSNQAYANVTVNFKNSVYFGLLIERRCTITAEVVEFFK